jgi:hypothetical protein
VNAKGKEGSESTNQAKPHDRSAGKTGTKLFTISEDPAAEDGLKEPS